MWLPTENKKAKYNSCNLNRVLHKTEFWKVRRKSNEHFKQNSAMLIVLMMVGLWYTEKLFTNTLLSHSQVACITTLLKLSRWDFCFLVLRTQRTAKIKKAIQELWFHFQPCLFFSQIHCMFLFSPGMNKQQREQTNTFVSTRDQPQDFHTTERSR